MKTLKYLLSNVLLTAVMVIGFIFENEGFRNIFAAFLWVYLVAAILCLNKSGIESIRAGGRTVSERTVFFIVSARFVFLAYFGAFFLAALYLLGAVVAGLVRYAAFDHKWEVA